MKNRRKANGLLGPAKRLLAHVNTVRSFGLGIEEAAAAYGIPVFGDAARAVGAVGNYMGFVQDADYLVLR